MHSNIWKLNIGALVPACSSMFCVSSATIIQLTKITPSKIVALIALVQVYLQGSEFLTNKSSLGFFKAIKPETIQNCYSKEGFCVFPLIKPNCQSIKKEHIALRDVKSSLSWTVQHLTLQQIGTTLLSP